MKRGWLLATQAAAACLMIAATNVGSSAEGEQPEAPIPVYTVRRAVGEIVVDGSASDPTWKTAVRVGRLVFWDGKECPDLTDVKMAWDDTALYVLFVCRDRDIQASLRDHDGPLYREDVVEIFIDADADEKTYMELIVNPLNATFDNFVLRDPRENRHAGILSWSLAEWRTAVAVDGTVRAPGEESTRDEDRSWTVEMAIPFASFVLTTGPSGKPPRDGDTWRMAITRYDRPDLKTFLHMSWSPTYSPGWPHITRRFGRVVFSDRLAGE